MSPYARRRTTNAIVLSLSLAATVFGLLWLAVILWTLLRHGVSAIGADLFVKTTPAPGNQGGLRNAIYGSVVMT
ncbi:MAG: phosphate ABC transporter permease PstA, partial [Acidimicrobiales bacterium]